MMSNKELMCKLLSLQETAILLLENYKERITKLE